MSPRAWLPSRMTDSAPDAGDWSLTRGLAGFAHALRAAGVAVGPAESADALAGVALIDPTDERAFRGALRACMAKNPDDCAVFDTVFDTFWHASIAEPAQTVEGEADARERDAAAQPAGQRARPTVSEREEQGSQTATDNDGAAGAGAAMGLDLARLEPAEQAAMDRLIRSLGRRLALTTARRWRASRRGALDLRASMRWAIAQSGEVLTWRRRYRPPQKPKLVVLADVSYSMDAYSRFFLLFVWSFGQVFRSIEAFVFATELSRITPALARHDMAAALDELGEQLPDWGGGTRIGDSIEAYLADHADDHLDRHTLVMIVSDGWDAGEPERLEAALAALRCRCRAIIWLDPLMEHPRFFATALGAQHASPHVDLCAPARNLQALSALAERLSGQRW